MEQQVVIKLGEMADSPGQMRTRYDLEKLAELTLMMYARGWDQDRPPLVRQENGKTEIIRGHRRRMAFLMSQVLLEKHPKNGEVTLTVEDALTAWQGMVEAASSVEEVVARLLKKYGDVEIAAQLFRGDAKQAVLALQGDNYGDEKPDPLGIARSLKYGVEVGATLREMAEGMGKSTNWARDYLALAQIDAELAKRVADGDLSLSVAGMLMSLPEEKRKAAVRFILEMDARVFKVTRFKDVVGRFREWNGIEAPLVAKHPFARNIGRSMQALFGRLLQDDATRAWYAGLSLMYLDKWVDPWENQQALTTWVDLLAGQPNLPWTARLPLVGITCADCPVSQLPAEKLNFDLGLPCRKDGFQGNGCYHGMRPDDVFDVRLTPNYAGLPGVVYDDGFYRAKSLADLQTAWQAQQAKEAAEAVAEADPPPPPVAVAAPTPAATGDKDKKKGKDKPAASTPATPAKAEGPSPVAKQREQIADYIARHAQMSHSHILATPCPKCQHKLDASPVKSDKKAPHCQWADRLRTVNFGTIELPGRVLIPVCSQYMPVQSWRELLPHHPAAPAQIQRDFLIDQIKSLVAGLADYQQSRPFMFLTGRPMGDEAWADWFSKRLAENAGDLTDEQLYSLFILALGERERFKSTGSTFWVPADGSMTQMVQARQAAWPAAVNGGK